MTAVSTASSMLASADRLLKATPTASAVTWRRGAAFALRAALEGSVAAFLGAARPRATSQSMRAQLLCLRAYVDGETARSAYTTWKLLCLGCHYHQYDLGPTEEQVRSWRAEVEGIVRQLAT